MKSKTIKLILSNKLKNFVKSVDDENVRNLVQHNTIITGGSIVSMLMKENVNDFDLYFRTEETALAVAEYYIKKAVGEQSKFTKGHIFKAVAHEGRVRINIHATAVINGDDQDEMENLEVGDEIAATELESAEDEKDGKYNVAFISSNAITLTNKIQCIIRFYGEPEEIHKNYDYVHCTSYWTSWDNNLVLHPAALESILTKELRYVGSLYPISSVVRLRKFLSRGWTINAGQIFKMCWQISKIDLSNVSVLEDQMVGVDSAYFRILISLMKEKAEEQGNKSQTIDETYLMTIIDKIF